jgi:hypothetical protein
MNSHDTLQRLHDSLSQGIPPTRLIEELLPRTRADALAWARRLPLWDEYRGQFSDQVVALARVISRRAMKAFHLSLTEDGRLRQPHAEGKALPAPQPSLTFSLTINGEKIRVEYTHNYFPRSGDLKDNFYFVIPHAPPRAHPLSETGHRSQFALHDAVEACGGPQAYATLFAEATLRGEEKPFAATFEGEWPDAEKPRRATAPKPVLPPAAEKMNQPVAGEHAAKVTAERDEPAPTATRPQQRTLF